MKRNTNIEFLRFLLMIFICIWHTMVHGYDYKNMSIDIIPNVYSILLMGFCSSAVNTFMFISGYYGINYSFDKLLRLVIQALLISNMVILVRFFCFDGQLSFYDQVLPLSSGVSWWFMSVYIVIMILSPILNSGVESISSRKLLILLGFLFFIYCIVKYRLGEGGANLATMLFVYLLGRYCCKVKIKWSPILSIVIWAMALFALYALMFYYLYTGQIESIWYLLSYNNPLVILMAVSAFFFILSFNCQLGRWAEFLGSHSLSIYLVSELIGIVLYKYWRQLLEESFFLFILSIIAFAIACECFDVPLKKLNDLIRKKIPHFLYLVSDFCNNVNHSDR